MADGRHIENRLSAISPRFIVRLTRNLVRWSIIMFRHRSSDQINNFRKFKMANGRHFENSFIAISQPRIVRFQWNLVCRCRFRLQGRPHDKISKYCKFKMADGRHFENRLLAICPVLLVYRSRVEESPAEEAEAATSPSPRNQPLSS